MARARWVHLGLAAAALVTYPALDGNARRGLYLVVALSASAMIALALRTRRPSHRLPWVLLGTGFGLSFLGEVLFYAYETSGEVPLPNASDVAYLLFYPFVFAAVGGFLRSAGHRDRAAWLDASIWTVGAFVLAWEPLVEPALTGSAADPLAEAVNLAYPLLDIGLLLMVVRLVAGTCVRTPAHSWLVIGLVTQTAADAVFSLQVVTAGPVGSLAQDLGYLVTYVAVGAAALHPSMPTLTEPCPVRTLSSRVRLAWLLVPTLAAPTMLVYELATGQLRGEVRAGVVIAAATAALMLLGVTRASGLLTIAERRTAELAERRAQLEAALTAGEASTIELHRRVNQDSLTGLASRERFMTALEAALVDGTQPSIAFLDLDDFKIINDTLGHEAGDLLLVTMAKRLRVAVGPGDLVARFGGDEFAVLVTGDVEHVAEAMLEAVRRPVLLHGRHLRVQVSIGVTTARPGATSTSDMLRRADLAMYDAKRTGGGWVRYRTGMSAQLRERMDARAQLVEGLRAGEIEPWFQPVVDLVTGELRGFEALARWIPADGPVLPPAAWLPIAEETGLIVSIDRVVCRAAVTQLAAWRGAYAVDRLTLAVNMSARTLQQRGVAEGLLSLLAELGIPPSRIVVEVTEGVLMDDEVASARIQLLRAAGVQVAIDDFGTGWSSLSYLQRFPVDQLKLDCSFTAELDGGPGGDAIPAAVCQLAHALSLDVVVEGVENEAQRARLVDLGFARAQGYLFGEAAPAAEQVARLPSLAPAVVRR